MALVLALAGSALLYTSCTKDYSPDIKSLQEQIDNINTSTTDGLPYVRTQLENLKSELGTLSGKVNGLDGDIDKLEAKVDKAIKCVYELEDAYDDLEAVKSHLEKNDAEYQGLIDVYVKSAIEHIKKAIGK